MDQTLCQHGLDDFFSNAYNTTAARQHGCPAVDLSLYDIFGNQLSQDAKIFNVETGYYHTDELTKLSSFLKINQDFLSFLCEVPEPVLSSFYQKMSTRLFRWRNEGKIAELEHVVDGLYDLVESTSRPAEHTASFQDSGYYNLRKFFRDIFSESLGIIIEFPTTLTTSAPIGKFAGKTSSLLTRAAIDAASDTLRPYSKKKIKSDIVTYVGARNQQIARPQLPE